MLSRTLAIVAAIGLVAGCNLAGPNRNYDAELAHYKEVARTVDHPQLTTPPSEHLFTPPPRTIDHNAAPQQPQEWWDMSVDEAIQTAVARSSVLRDLGGTVIRSPETSRTILGPALVSTDARFGMEAALSEFDATLASSVVAEKNDRMINNFVASGGTRFFQQDLINFQSQISKVGIAGTRMTLRGLSTYDFNNASFNRFPSVWDSLVEAEIRQPLYQGAGARFNRLAGPNAVPGFYNGVLIARVSTDISVADFEIGLRDLVSNVENAYWDLYFAFRDLDAKIQARNAALETWNRIRVIVESDQEQGNIEREMQAREQYFRYEEDVQNALAGTLQASTTNNNGSSGGSFRGLGGVLVSERRLRLAIGLPITDGRMIRPVEAPTAARVTFDWPTASDDAVSRRPELLRQRLAVKRREMEFVAARNFLLPRFDILGRYRVRGLGQGLLGDVDLPPDPVGDPNNLFENSSLRNLALGNFQEWQLGGEISLPIGFRRGHAAVRNAQLLVAREKAVLEEQERQVIHDLSNALGDVERAYKLMETTYNRRLAASQNVDVIRFRLQNGQPVTPEQLLEAERRMAEADTQYHRALVEHMLAIKNVHFEKGTLLEYGHIQLAEQVSIESARPPPPAEQLEPTPAAPPVEPTPAPPPAQPPQFTPQPPPPFAPPAPMLAPPAPTNAPPASAAPIGSGLPPLAVQPPPAPRSAPVFSGLPPVAAQSLPSSTQPPQGVVQPVQVAPQLPAENELPPVPAPAPPPPRPTEPSPTADIGLPPLAPAARLPLLQWSRPARPVAVEVPADPFVAPAPPPPQRPLDRLPPLDSRQSPAAAPIEQLGYARDAAAPSPSGDVAVPVQAPAAPARAAVWQPPAQTQPAPAMQLPQPAPEPPPVRLPQPGPPLPLHPTLRLPEPAPDARSENEFQRLPLPFP